MFPSSVQEEEAHLRAALRASAAQAVAKVAQVEALAAARAATHSTSRRQC